MSISIETCAAQHIGDRREQQDRLALIPHPGRPGLLMAVVADGMGGHTGGALAAEQVILKARQNLAGFMEAESPKDLLRSVIEESHIVIKLTRFTSEQDPHSTAAVLLVQPERIDWAYSGDSRIYHFRGERLMSCTTDHSLVMDMVKKGQISEAEAAIHPQRNVLIGCLGSEIPPMIDYGEHLPPFGDDTFLLCSDGLWGYFGREELGGILAANAPRAAAEQLIHRARIRGSGGGDNISLIIIKMTRRVDVKPAAKHKW